MGNWLFSARFYNSLSTVGSWRRNFDCGMCAFQMAIVTLFLTTGAFVAMCSRLAYL